MSSAKFIISTEQAARTLKVQPPDNYRNVEKKYPLLVSDYYLNLIDNSRKDIENDPIWLQCMPSADELKDENSDLDPLAEEVQMAVPRLIHRYPDRAVLLATGKCATRCRFCFRKRTWTDGRELSDISKAELAEVCTYLRVTPTVSEVLISGGDPLMLSRENLRFILDELNSIESISVLRLGTRVPVTLPALVNPETIKMLASYPGLWLMTHFNHSRELTAESIALCRKFIKSGIPLLNQTVLLKGVNDNAETLEKLFRQLITVKIKPHYLFHVDPVRGVRHFATGIDKGLDILARFRSNLSSLAVPAFAIDLPEGGGKVALQPEYCCEGKYPSVVDGHLIEY
ncbi:MAG: KamA family radical SAM protein [Victivallaceae bacterium]|nr:KamA family radical SAM protein [Victivallaceae bacterium]